MKKIIPNGSYHDIQFERQPGVSFGDFNRDADIYELMVANAPISKEKLVISFTDNGLKKIRLL